MVVVLVVMVVMVVVMCAGWLGRPAAEAPGAQVSGLDQEPRSRYVVFSASHNRGAFVVHILCAV